MKRRFSDIAEKRIKRKERVRQRGIATGEPRPKSPTETIRLTKENCSSAQTYIRRLIGPEINEAR